MGLDWRRVAVLLALYGILCGGLSLLLFATLGMVAQIAFLPIAFFGGMIGGAIALNRGWLDGV